MLDSSGPNQVETRRILVCPYCGRLQRAITSPCAVWRRVHEVPSGVPC